MDDYMMPSLGADIEQGQITAWHVKAGDHVKRGDVVADVETDKGTIEIEIWQTGVVSEILVEPGTKVHVGTPLARISPANDDINDRDVFKIAKQLEAPLTDISRFAVKQRISPLARRVADELKMDIRNIKGTGEGGAITKQDVESYAQLIKKDISSIPLIEIEPNRSAQDRSASMRRAIAHAMSKSKREIPHYYLQTEISINATMKWLTNTNSKRPITERILPIAVTLKAIAIAAKKIQEMNGFYREDRFIASREVHLGVAISLREGGLVAPAIHNADQLSLPDLMKNLLDLVQRARSGKLRGSEVADQTITVTNLGDSGVDAIFGVIHPPQVAMVGIGRISERVITENGMIGPSLLQTLTLSADHRASDGHRGAQFLAEITRLHNNPDQL